MRSSFGVMITSPGFRIAEQCLALRPLDERHRAGDAALDEMPVDGQVVLHGVAFDPALLGAEAFAPKQREPPCKPPQYNQLSPLVWNPVSPSSSSMQPERGALALAAYRSAQSCQAASANSKDGPMLTDFE